MIKRTTLKSFNVRREHCDKVELCFYGFHLESGRCGYYEIWVHDPHGTYYDGENMDSLEYDVPTWECIAAERWNSTNVAKMYKRAKALATRD